MNPIAFHFNGKAIGKYEPSVLHKLQEELDKNNSVTSPDVELFTYDDKLDNPFLIDCCKKLNLNLINLASKDRVGFLSSAYPVNKNYPSERFTLLFKILSLYHFLKDGGTKKKYYALLDQSDIFLTKPFGGEQLDILKEKGCHILYNSETRCMYWPMLFRKDERYSDLNKFFMNYTDVKQFEQHTYSHDCYQSNNHKTCFLNGGAVLGEVDFFVQFVDKYLPFIKEFINVNEQTMLHHFHFCYYPDIQIDHKCDVFQCMGPNKIELNLS